MVVLSRRLTTLEYLAKDYYIDKIIGELLLLKPSNSGQLIIEEYPKQASLNRIKTFTGFKALLVRWIVYYYVAFFQFKNAYFR